MKLDIIRPKNRTEDLLLSKTKNCDKFFKQTHREPQKSFENKLTTSKKTFCFQVFFIFCLDSERMHGLTSL